jgi:hypothetical protein
LWDAPKKSEWVKKRERSDGGEVRREKQRRGRECGRRSETE